MYYFLFPWIWPLLGVTLINTILWYKWCSLPNPYLMQCPLLGNSCSWYIPFGSQLPCCEKPTCRHSVTSPRWSHSWSQYQLPIMWTSPIKLLDDCNLGLIDAGELLSWAHRIMSNNGIVILSHSALELFVRKQYVIRICCHSMSWATILHSQTIMGSSFLGSRWVIWLQNSIFKICFLGPLGTNYLKSGPLRNIYWDRIDICMHKVYWGAIRSDRE